MDIGRAFSFVTEDEAWLTKLLLGGVIGLLGSIIIIGPIALQGYMIETARNVMLGNPRPLSDWSNFGDKLAKGFIAIVINIVYALPLFVLACIAFFILAAGGNAASNSSNGSGGAALGLLGACVFGLIFLGAIVLVPVYMAALVRYIQTNSLSAALDFRTVLSTVRATPGTWLMLFLMSILTSLVGQLGSIACGIGLFLTIPYASVVLGHTLGQAAAQTAGAPPSYGQTPPPSYGPPPTYQ